MKRKKVIWKCLYNKPLGESTGWILIASGEEILFNVGLSTSRMIGRPTGLFFLAISSR
jgi:hypothetical protein